MNPTFDNREPREAGGVSRRTVTKAAAWSIPAIALAAPVPVHAASTPDRCNTVFFDSFTAGCHVGSGDQFEQQTYGWFVRIHNTGAQAEVVQVARAEVGGVGVVEAKAFTTNSSGLVYNVEVPIHSPMTIPAGSSTWWRFEVKVYVANPTTVAMDVVQFDPRLICPNVFAPVSFTERQGSCPVIMLNP